MHLHPVEEVPRDVTAIKVYTTVRLSIKVNQSCNTIQRNSETWVQCYSYVVIRMEAVLILITTYIEQYCTQVSEFSLQGW